jgi:hypothetical protein
MRMREEYHFEKFCPMHFGILSAALEGGAPLTPGVNCARVSPLLRGRTGFDLVDTLEAACRGWFVGLVNHSDQTLSANEELALAA